MTFDCTGSPLSCNLHLYLALKLRRFLALLVTLESYPQMFVATWIRHVAGQADLSAPTGLLTCRASGSVTPFACIPHGPGSQRAGKVDRQTVSPRRPDDYRELRRYDGNGNAEETPALDRFASPSSPSAGRPAIRPSCACGSRPGPSSSRSCPSPTTSGRSYIRLYDERDRERESVRA